MKDFINYIRYYIISLAIVSFFWYGLEFILGIVHYSFVDGIIAIILSLFVTDKIMYWR